jgi:hypothetical protein
MKWLGLFLAAGAIIAAGQAVAVVLAILVAIGLVTALFECPRELFGMIGLCLVGALMQAQPLAFIALVALMVVANLLHKLYNL